MPKLITLQTYAFPIISGLMLTAAFPKPEMAWTAWIALIPLFAAIRDLDPGAAFRAGFLAGLAHYLTLIYWLTPTMQTYGGLPVYQAVPLLFLLAAYLSLYIAGFAGIITMLRLSPGRFLLLAPCLWVSLEYLRSFLLTGFPWELLGYSQYKHLGIIQMADICGVYGVTFILLLANCAVFIGGIHCTGIKWQGFGADRRTAWGSAMLLSVVLMGAWGYGVWRIQSVEPLLHSASLMNTSVIQGNIDQNMKWDIGLKQLNTLKYIKLSADARKDGPELLVWPETAAPFYFLHERELTNLVLKSIVETRAYCVIGSVAFARNRQGHDYYNSAYLIHPDGTIGGRYDKVHLVPFGEYVPLKKWLPFVEKMVTAVGDFKTGRKGETLNIGPHRIGILICYEGIFPELARAAAANGAGLLVNITNDAWYGRSSAPYQHFSMVVFRAVENRRSLIRSANTGISGFIDPLGRIQGATPLFEEAVMTRPMPAVGIKTVYTRFGDLFARICAVVTILSMIILRRRLAAGNGSPPLTTNH
jgi:apolipoprotein N-acyltransferase